MKEILRPDGYTIKDYSNAELSQLEDVWRELESGSDMTAFQSYDWYWSLHQLYPRERTKNLFRQWRYIAVWKDEQPLLIAPVELKRFGLGYKNLGAAPRGVYFIGRLGHTDYLNFIYSQFDAGALDALLSYISQSYLQRRFCFDRILESAESWKYLQEAHAAKAEPESCAALVLPESFEIHQKALSKSTRQNIRTAVNRANRNGIQLTHELIFDEAPEIKDTLRILGEQRAKKKNANSRREMSFAGSVYCFFAGIFRKLFSAKLDVLYVSKRTFTFLVKDGERIVSYFWGIRNDYLKELYVILVSVDPEYEYYSPNISHLYLFLEEYYQANRNDISLIDFTRGAEGYKKTIGCTTRSVSTLRFQIP